jgi:hypothetical protein
MSGGCIVHHPPQGAGTSEQDRPLIKARILLANPQVPKWVCPTCLLGRRKSLEISPEKKYS